MLDYEEARLWEMFATVGLHAQMSHRLPPDAAAESAAKAADKMLELRRLRVPKREPRE